MDYTDIAIAKPTIIRGTDTADMTEESCITLIKKEQDKIASLKALNIQSATIDARIDESYAVIAALIERLDQFAPKA